MNRRSFLARGGAAAVGASLAAGCLERSGDGGSDAPDDPNSGYAPNPRDVEAPDADPASFEQLDVDGTAVPLVPIDVAHPWYLREEARFVDARSMTAYQDSRVAGAALSPAPDGYDDNDPMSGWSTGDRIVTYCGCPHHLSSQRAASLIESGFEAVYALDEGFGEWFDRDYPTASANGAPNLAPQHSLTGAVDTAYAGEFVQLHHAPTDQREPAEIREDGRFEVTFRFADFDADDPLVLDTPAWTRRGTMGELTDR